MKAPAALVAVLLAFLLAQPSRLLGQETRTIRADNAPVWGDDVQLVEELRIGVLDGEPEYTFGSIADAAMGPDGSIFVVDGQGPVVRKYGRDGEYILNGKRGVATSRPGSGPVRRTSIRISPG